MQVLERGWITSQQIEACRVAITRFFNRRGKVWIRIFPDKPVTKKPAETRMGKGKGNPEFWVSVVKRGRIIIELGGGLSKEARARFRRAVKGSRVAVVLSLDRTGGAHLPRPTRSLLTGVGSRPVLADRSPVA